jgi:hypothetical protein
MPYTLRFYLYLLIAGVVAFVLGVWLTPLGAVVNAVFANRCRLSRHRRRATGVWKETVMKLLFQ